ncbi:P-loop containing nucleoside triphosphate hydrolase [Pyrrhoderma noxium]|uniref:P-loop containing nucleoside triphosphate hydrolase n=1 Tax=Pyrrhoderma noxium TaxID=2282107 RepID=A0A286U978_9AGAM|nr:P-loop containing nucleoside triphosphate hydrolase [Pyrrhoderma noxium]
MRLRTILYGHPETVLKAFENSNIRSAEEFLISSENLQELYQRLPAESITFAELEVVRDYVLATVASNGYNGYELAEKARSANLVLESPLWTKRNRISTFLSTWTHGIIEVAGEGGSAKSTFALNAVVNYLTSEQDASVHWIDTVGTFSVDRATRIIAAFSDSYNVIAQDSSSTSSASNRLHVSLAFTVESATGILAAIRSLVESDSSSTSVRSPDAACQGTVRLIVIDQVTTLFSHVLTTGSSEGHAMLAAFMRELRDITETYKILALILNNSNSKKKTTHSQSENKPGSSYGSTSKINHKPKPALGITMTFLADTTLWLEKAHDAFSYLSSEEQEEKFICGCLNNEYTVEILRSRTWFVPPKWAFMIGDNGVIT